ncbi:MAG: tetratricopeptide repeat protein [Rhodospirillaceae bacterium]|nr:tetratricopeptide repeat protein [Rhodospirillaceae bacterium]
MPFLALAVLALVLVLSVHVCQTGRSKMWLPVIWMLPVLGSVIYVLVEMLPQLWRGNEIVSTADPRFEQILDEEIDRKPAERRRLQQQPKRFADVPKDPLREGSVHEKLKNAEACLASHRYDEAVDLFTAARQGFFADSPDIILGLARAHFGRGDLGAARGLLDELTTGRPAYQPHAVAILRARVLARQGEAVAALSLLDAILAQNDNLEGRRLEAQYRHAEILWQQGETDRAASELTEILRHEKLFRIDDDDRRWIRLAGQALKAIS